MSAETTLAIAAAKKAPSLLKRLVQTPKHPLAGIFHEGWDARRCAKCLPKQNTSANKEQAIYFSLLSILSRRLMVHYVLYRLSNIVRFVCPVAVVGVIILLLAIIVPPLIDERKSTFSENASAPQAAVQKVDYGMDIQTEDKQGAPLLPPGTKEQGSGQAGWSPKTADYVIGGLAVFFFLISVSCVICNFLLRQFLKFTDWETENLKALVAGAQVLEEQTE